MVALWPIPEPARGQRLFLIPHRLVYNTTVQAHEKAPATLRNARPTPGVLVTSHHGSGPSQGLFLLLWVPGPRDPPPRAHRAVSSKVGRGAGCPDVYLYRPWRQSGQPAPRIHGVHSAPLSGEQHPTARQLESSTRAPSSGMKRVRGPTGSSHKSAPRFWAPLARWPTLKCYPLAARRCRAWDSGDTGWRSGTWACCTVSSSL